jgi:hypothetical protein
MRNYSLVIATRLYASILANSLGITTLGLGWDEKVASYYTETCLIERYVNLTGLQVSALVLTARGLNWQPLSTILLVKLKFRAMGNAHVILSSTFIF